MDIKSFCFGKSLCNTKLQQGIIDVYCQAFGGYPWFEQHNPSEVATKLLEEMQQPGALLIWAQEKDLVIALAWGYTIQFGLVSSRNNLSRSDMMMSLLERDKVIEKKLDAPGISSMVSTPIFYLSEFAVTPKYQQQGIGRQMLAVLRAQCLGYEILLRTLDGCPMAHLVYKTGGSSLMSISKNRIMMILPRL